MTAITENDLKRLEDLIINGQKAIESRLISLEAGQAEIKADIKSLEAGQAEIKADIKALDEKVQGIEIKLATIAAEVKGIDKRTDDINGRLNIMTIGFLSIVGILVTGILGIIGKVTFFPNNP